MTAAGTRPAPALRERLRDDPTVAALRAARRGDALPYFRAAESAAAPVVRIDGRERIMLGSANYLGLADDARVRAAARAAIDRFGATTTGSRLLNGTCALHEELEEELADWYGTEAAIVFTTGYQANVGTISALLAPGDTAVIDSADHASLQDGCRLSGAKVRAFRHNRRDLFWDAIERAAERDDGGVLAVVDGVYSMEGDVAPLDEIAAGCERHGALLMVDEAHAVGLLGAGRTGAAEHYGVERRVDVRMAALSKALAGLGGFVAGSADLVDYLRVHARAMLFSTAGTPASVAAALAALRICRGDEGAERAERAKRNAQRLRAGLSEIGFDLIELATGPDGREIVTPIVPVVAGEDERALRWWRTLYERGVFTAAAVPPAVPPGSALLRLCPMATHGDEHVDAVVDAFAELWRSER